MVDECLTQLETDKYLPVGFSPFFTSTSIVCEGQLLHFLISPLHCQSSNSRFHSVKWYLTDVLISIFLTVFDYGG